MRSAVVVVVVLVQQVKQLPAQVLAATVAQAQATPMTV
jgi:hypothetical protein